jgi:pimeloyl-ACP methyl ester carboxylesterase
MQMTRLLIFGILIYLGLGLYLYLAQRDFIYFPVPAAEYNYDETVFENDGYKIKVTVLNRGNNRAIIYFGGNAENIDYNIEGFSQHFSEYTVYLVKYRGYGGSSGNPTEEGIYSDALYIYDAINKEHDGVSAVGRSLGSAVATYIASLREVDRLVLITPFDSMQNIAQSHFPIYPMSILLKDKYDSVSRVGQIKAETLVLAAGEDRIVGITHTQRLVAAFSQDVQFHLIEGVGHNNISGNPRFYALLDEFM